MPDPLVLTEIVDGVGVLSFNRPDRHNAISDELHDQWGHALTTLLDDDKVRCVLLRGEGRSFCSGRDTAQLGYRANDEDDYSFVRRHQQLRLRTLDARQPIVAAVRGYALGGGFEIALSADIRVIADDAVFALPEVGLGLVPDTGGTQLLTRLVGPARAKYLILSSARIDAAKAVSWGLAEDVVSSEELDSRAMELCSRIAAQPRLAVSMAKQLVDDPDAGRIRRGIGHELIAQTALFSSDEYRTQQAERSRIESRKA
ncbi:enoyl-CoA hydratase/isomerase family protein [Nocardia harenae]|uniref:enoyl-CoA hydratase/isomerase family protein n=1 Tax=Nocardia harenae TaxID=358707 RepID=UPI000831D2E7|nr:enoyl-CoA hydratase/isomerase family protein [Nocardia harenae]